MELGAAPGEDSAPDSSVPCEPDVMADNEEPESDQDEGDDPSADTDGGTAELRGCYLVPSLFKQRPATVWFEYPASFGIDRQTDREHIYAIDSKFQPLLFRYENNLNCVSHAFKRNGFEKCGKSANHNAFWGGFVSESVIRKMLPHQRINHFPGSMQLGRKDNIWKNISVLRRTHPQDYDFCAKTYLLPHDTDILERDWEELGKNAIFILKPPGSSCGRGVRLAVNFDDVPKRRKLVVQRYLGDPYLIDKKKFDLRVYVCVTSFDPLRIYLFEDGLARFATHDYNPKAKKRLVKDRFMHLTNYSVNKKSQTFVNNQDAKNDQDGSKWSMKALWRYLEEEQGCDVDKIKASIKDVIVKTIIAAEPKIVGKCNSMWLRRGQCFELFGFDILLDKNLKAWLIEVNVMPSLSSTSPLDKYIKHTMMTDIFHMVGFVPCDRSAGDQSAESLHGGRKSRVKTRSVNDLKGVSLRDLSQSDLEAVMEAEDEYHRRGHFERIFPLQDVDRFAKYFAVQRYMNTLLWKWVKNPDPSILRSHFTDRALEVFNMQRLQAHQNTFPSVECKSRDPRSKHAVPNKRSSVRTPPEGSGVRASTALMKLHSLNSSSHSQTTAILHLDERYRRDNLQFEDSYTLPETVAGHSSPDRVKRITVKSSQSPDTLVSLCEPSDKGSGQQLVSSPQPETKESNDACQWPPVPSPVPSPVSSPLSVTFSDLRETSLSLRRHAFSENPRSSSNLETEGRPDTRRSPAKKTNGSTRHPAVEMYTRRPSSADSPSLSNLCEERPSSKHPVTFNDPGRCDIIKPTHWTAVLPGARSRSVMNRKSNGEFHEPFFIQARPSSPPVAFDTSPKKSSGSNTRRRPRTPLTAADHNEEKRLSRSLCQALSVARFTDSGELLPALSFRWP